MLNEANYKLKHVVMSMQANAFCKRSLQRRANGLPAECGKFTANTALITTSTVLLLTYLHKSLNLGVSKVRGTKVFYPLSRLTGLMLALMVLLGANTSARSSDYDLATVITTAINNNGTWFDPAIGDEARPDFVLTASLIDGNGQRVMCGTSPLFKNMERVSTATILCSGVEILKPFRVEFLLNEDDAERGPSLMQVADLDLATAAFEGVSTTFSGEVSPPLTSLRFNGEAEVTALVSTLPAIPRLDLFSIRAPRRGIGNIAQFDPTIGESISIIGRILTNASVPTSIPPVLHGGKVTVSITPQNPAAIGPDQQQNIAALSGLFLGRKDGGFSYDFNGGYFDWNSEAVAVLPEGFYEVRLKHEWRPGEVVQTPPLVFEVRHTTLAQFSNAIFPTVFDADAQRFVLSYVSTAEGRGTFYLLLPALAGGCATAPPGPGFPSNRIIAMHSNIVVVRGPNTFEWDRNVDLGGLVQSGVFCMVFNGETTAGSPFNNRMTGRITVTRPPVLAADVRMSPVSPALVTSGTPEIVATALNMSPVSILHKLPVVARQIDILTTRYRGPGSPSPVLVKTCLGTSVCTLPVPRGAGTVAYRAIVSNALATFSTPIRLTDVDRGGGELRISTSAAVQADGTISELPHNRTIDVVYYAGTGYDITTPGGISTFSERLKDEYEVMLGVSPSLHQPSSVFDNLAATNFFVSVSPATIKHNSVFTTCEHSTPRPTSYGDAHGILHPNLPCRDWAIGVQYSAGDPVTSWHEFHHNAFGMSDEYCQYTIHYQPGRFPNVYDNLAECRARSTNPSTCLSIADSSNCPAGRTCACNAGYFRSDPGFADVMSFDQTIEQGDDLRAANGKYADCSLGRC